MSKVPMTVAGAQRLKVELQRLKTIERPAVIMAIADARSRLMSSGSGPSVVSTASRRALR